MHIYLTNVDSYEGWREGGRNTERAKETKTENKRQRHKGMGRNKKERHMYTEERGGKTDGETFRMRLGRKSTRLGSPRDKWARQTRLLWVAWIDSSARQEGRWIFLNISLIYSWETHTHTEAETQAKGEAGSMQGDQWTRSQDPRITSWAKGSRSTTGASQASW